MSLRQRIANLFSVQKGAGDDAIYLYVRCANCGARLRVRVDRQHDLSYDYEREEGYVLRKEMMDSRCFRLMYATLRFDRNYRVVSREITGGEFITQEEYEK